MKISVTAELQWSDRKKMRQGKIMTDKKGNVPDADLRDFENVPLKEDIEKYFQREVIPHVPDAWIDHGKTKVGYENNFTKFFYQYKPLRSWMKSGRIFWNWKNRLQEH
jgi:type I restriction enzyme M protein